MANKKKFYMVVDTETATMPIVTEIAQTPEEKKKLAIAKPLIYDIGWTITDRSGNIIKTAQYLIAETFAVPQVFNTAYYAAKRPLYIEMLNRGETTIKPWHDVMKIFMEDAASVDAVGAFNAMFDFKKAIPFTELYINKLYSANYYEWENMQRNSCENILRCPPRKENENFEPDLFRFRKNIYPLFDLWGLATTYLLNNVSYKSECLKHNLLTNSGTFFKTSAESTYQYLCKKYDFVESHTALDDAVIETFILSKIAQKHAIDIGIKYFPFRDLGYTDEFVTRTRKPKMNDCQTVYDAIYNYVLAKVDETTDISNYTRGLIYRLQDLARYMGYEPPFMEYQKGGDML